jgi:hypothetical protein
MPVSLFAPTPKGMTHDLRLSDQKPLELLEWGRLPHDPLGRVDLPS